MSLFLIIANALSDLDLLNNDIGNIHGADPDILRGAFVMFVGLFFIMSFCDATVLALMLKIRGISEV